MTEASTSSAVQIVLKFRNQALCMLEGSQSGRLYNKDEYSLSPVAVVASS